MVIAEAPGKEEDEQGIPLIGASGSRFRKALARVASAFNLQPVYDDLLTPRAPTRKLQVYLTNVTKCRPPKNRTPYKKERVACRPYWQEEIETLRPRVILLLGGTAAHEVLALSDNKQKVVLKHDREKWWHYVCEDGTLIPCRLTYHPATVMRDPRQQVYFMKDLQTVIRRLVDG